MAKTKVNYEDVIEFFEDADIDLANLTHQLVTSRLNARIEKRQEIGERLSKARKARKPKTEGTQAGEAVATAVANEPVSQPTEATEHRGPGRPRAISA